MITNNTAIINADINIHSFKLLTYKYKIINYFFPLYDKNPIEIRVITTIIAPNIVTLVPENSPPNSNPRPIPPITPMDNPVFSMLLLPPNYSSL